MEFVQRIDGIGETLRAAKPVKNPDTNIWFRASTGTVDRHGEIVVPKGIHLENYKKNPVFGWSHNVYGWSMIEDFIGKTVDFDHTDKYLDIEVEFIPTAGLGSSGYSYLDMVKGGFLSAVSIGFKGISWHEEEKEGRVIRFWDETDLLEVSLVGVPANPEAVTRSLSLGFKEMLLKDFGRPEAPPNNSGADAAEGIRRSFQALRIKHAFQNIRKF